MYIKNQLRKRFIISAITVIIMVITILGSSYALFMDIKPMLMISFNCW